jgi:hypothetical protein
MMPHRVKRMKAIEIQEGTVLSDEVNKGDIAPDNSGYTLNIAGVYQDMLTRYWAMQTCHWATQFAREGRVQNKWFNVNSLNDPGIFVDAVRAALVADVIMVSVYAADELPSDLYVWFEAWLPRRPTRMGALSALIGVAEPLDSQSVRTREYLQAVARKGQLDFIPQERKRPVASPADSIALIAEPGGTTAQALQKRYGPRYDAYYH